VRELPSGTVTFLFTDIEGSTRLLHELGAEGYADALAEHRRVLREAFAAHGGVEVDTQGDAFFVAFARASDACAAAQGTIGSSPIPTRIGLHTGEPLITDEGYVGNDVHKAARICAAGHGGQILLSQSTRDLAAVDARDLGLHRLKDLSAPVRLFQLDDVDHAPLRTLHQVNLPVVSSSLIGRGGELTAVLELARRPGVRLVTFTGVGGTGKTRLALQVAAELVEEFPGGVWFVGLAEISDVALVLPTVVQTLGARGGLEAHLGDRRLLLVLDNLEQVIRVGPDLAGLLAACPNTSLLVTSREPLHIRGEHEFPVPPLVLSEAEALFLQRALAVDPGFVPDAAVREICVRLDALPLAIELAAARVKVLAPSKLLERLERVLPTLTGGARDAPERQRTLRATIEWSYGLLDPDEQQLFRRLAVFAGGFDLDAAEAVTESDFDTLGSLVDKNLVRRRAGTDRYLLFETIREFALERLSDSGESDRLAGRHAEHFLAFAEGVGGTDILEGGEARRVARLADETANFRVAIDWALGQERVDLVSRFGTALWEFWLFRGHTREGRRWLEWAVARVDSAADEWIWAVVGLSEIARFQGATERARELKEEAVRVLADRGETRLRAGLLTDLADLEMERGALDSARDLLDASLALRSPDLPQGMGRTLSSFATLAVHEDDLERADALLKEASDLHRDFDAASDFAGGALAGRAEVARRRGEAQEAELLFGQALRIFHAFRDPAQVADCLEGLAALAEAAGRMERAGRLVGAAHTMRSSSEIPGIWPERVPRDTPDEAQRSGERMDLDEAVDYALSTVD
jgi:predicted ATPase